MSKVIMGNGDFTVAQSAVKLNQAAADSCYPIVPTGIVAYAFTLLLDNLCRNSCMSTFPHT